MATPIVSIILPVHNGKAHLREAIESIRAQTLQDFELLVIDDGSTDGSADIAASIPDDRLQIYRQQKEGLIAKLNFGLQEARGAYIARMDGDDISLPNRLQAQVNFLEAHPGVGICGTWSECFTPTGKSWITRQPVDPDLAWATLLLRVPLSHPTVMFRSDLVRIGNWSYRPSALNAEDYDLWARVGEDAKLSNVPQVLLRYRIHENQVSSSNTQSQNLSSASIRRNLLEKLGLNPSKVELSFHEKISGQTFENRTGFLHELDEWLQKIHQANQVTGRYKVAALQMIFRSAWISAALANKHEGSSIRRIQATNPLIGPKTQWQLQALRIRSWLRI